MISTTSYHTYLDKGTSYDDYKQNMAADLLTNADSQTREYIHLNQTRMQRVEKTFVASAMLLEKIKQIPDKIYWLTLTEHWCGDAAQVIPALHTIAQLSDGKIEMKLVYRDQNDELMNEYLTNGTRSIPKIIQLNEAYKVLGTWGPRPAEAQQLVLTLKANPETAPTYSNALHLWYAKDKQRSIEKEISTLLSKIHLFNAE